MRRLFLLTSILVLSTAPLALGGEESDDARPADTEGGAVAPEPLESRQVIAGPSAFSDNSITLSPVVRDYIDLYSTEHGIEYIETSLRRGLPYRDFILSVLDRYRMPRELYYLALIESGFDARAESRSGATGLWQFMENSVEDWMTINSWVDERRDFYRSTIAAVEKLAGNFTILEDWLLAIAAYNAGLGHIQRAVEAAGTRDFWELMDTGLLPDQTEDYVPKFLAVTWIAEHAGRYGITPNWLPPLVWTRVNVPGGLDLETLAAFSGLDTVAIHSWNVHLNTPHIPVGTPSYELNIPEMHRHSVERALSILPGYRSLAPADRRPRSYPEE
ncbi:MAG: lytic transglycosylase domain-containing protein [Spirochaetota bacterium]